MPKHKLIYFDGRGRGELIRQVFALAGQEYEDHRVSGEEWAVLKPDTPFGQLPLLQEDGQTVLAQSLSIARYLARKFGLAGKTEHEQAWADMIVDCTEDIIKAVTAIFSCKDDAYKEELKNKFKDQQLPDMLAKFEKLLSGNKSGVFVGDEITWCDLAFVIGVSWADYVDVQVEFEKYPKIADHKNKVESNPRIQEWLKKRPVTKM